MEKEIIEFNNAIRECRTQLERTLESSIVAVRKIDKVMSDSHLRSVLGWIRTDLELYGILKNFGTLNIQ